MRKQSKNTRFLPALTLTETVVSLAIMAIVFAVLLPQVRSIRNSWDARAGGAETVQHGRVLVEHLRHNLSKAVSITDVSGSAETDGYIEFEDNASSTLRYDIAANNNVEFGTIGSLNDIAGPVSELVFTCYDGNDLTTAITDGNDIRLVNVQATLPNASAAGRDLTVKTSVYLRTGLLPGEVVDPNLILWLKLDESSGETAADSSGNGNHGTLVNMADDDWVAGQIGNALDFDGGNDYVDCGNDDSLNITDEITMSAWINMSARPAKNAWFNLHCKENFAYAMYIQGADTALTTLGAYFVLDTGTKDLWNLTSIDIDPSNGWAHVAVTFDNTDVKFYVNGVLDHTENEPGTINDNAGSDFIFVDGESEWFGGSVDDIRVYNRALSGAEVGALYYLSGPAYREFTEAKLDSDGTSLTISTPSGAVEDSLLIAAIATDGDTTASLAPPAGEGWSQVFLNDQDGQVTIGVWWKLADASESGSHEFTWSGNQQAYGWMMRFAGHDTTDPIDVYSADGETDSNPSSPPVTTTSDNCLILRLGAFDDSDITLDDPGLSGHTAITMDSSQSSGVSYEEFTEAKAGSGTDELTLNTPAGTAEGDLLIAAVVTNDMNKLSLAPPAGENWTEIKVDSREEKVTIGVWWKLAEASESPSHEFTWDDDKEAYGWMMRFTGHDPSDPIGQWEKLESASDTPDCPSVTTVAANSMVLRIGGFDDDDVTVGDAGMSGHTTITMDMSDGGKGSCSGGAAYVLQAGPGPGGTSEFILTANQESVCVTVAIEAAPPGAGSASGGAGYVTQASSGSSGFSSFSLTASEEARTVTIAIAPAAQ